MESAFTISRRWNQIEYTAVTAGESSQWDDFTSPTCTMHGISWPLVATMVTVTAVTAVATTDQLGLLLVDRWLITSRDTTCSGMERIST